MTGTVMRCPNCGSDVVGARFCPDCGHALATRISIQERRQVTALFADLVASTEIGGQLDPEIMRGYVARFFERATEEIQLRGGSVERFSGDAVLALFGLTQAHEDDPERAVRAALAIHAAMEDVAPEARERHGRPFQARIGIESGEVVAGDPFGGRSMATGGPVNLAARLETSAGPGETIIGPQVHATTARTIRSEPAGEWELHGIRQPTPAWRVVGPVGEIGTTHGIPGLRAPLTGRDEELASVLKTAAGARSDRAAVLLSVLGAPGVGKSRLVEEAAARLTEDGWQILRGRCLPYGAGITYWPVAEIVRAAAGVDERQPAAVALERLKAVVDDPEAASRLAAAIGLTSSAPASGEAVAAEIAWAFHQLAAQLARTRPTALVFEDIHWAEPPLLDLIEHLAIWVRDAPLLLVCLARPELFDRRPTWGTGHMASARLNLEPLTRSETATLVGALLRIGSLPAALRDRILDTAEGNPLFAEETIRMLIERGRIARSDDRWVAVADPGSVKLPESIEGLIRARLDGVPREERAVLQCASVIGRTFWADAVRQLVGDDVTKPLDDAVLRDLLAPEPGTGRSYTFRHVLIRDVAYATLPKARRAELHAGVVAWLSEWAGDRADEFVEIEAYHRERAVLLARELRGQADASQVAAAIDALERSARKAARADDWGALIGWADRALALDPQPAERHAELDALLLDGLTAMEQAERAADVGVRLLAEAEAVGRRDLRGWALYGISRDPSRSPVPSQRTATPDELLSEARRELEVSGDLRRLRPVVWALADNRCYSGEPHAAIPLWRAAAGIADASDDPGPQIAALLRVHKPLFWLGRKSDADDVLREAEALGERTSLRTQSRLWYWRGNSAFWYGDDIDGGEALVRKALDVFTEAGWPTDVREARTNLALMRAMLGDTAGATVELEELLASLGNVPPAAEAAAWLAYAWAPSDVARAEEYADLASKIVDPADVMSVAATRMALGSVRDVQGRDDEAERLLHEALTLWEATQLVAASLGTVSALAVFHLRRGHRADGDGYAKRVEDTYRETWGERSPALAYARHLFAAARAEGRRRAAASTGTGNGAKDPHDEQRRPHHPGRG